jgi:hypothetical protein
MTALPFVAEFSIYFTHPLGHWAGTLIVAIFLPLRATNTFAHGIVGDRIFLSPIVGNDAFPSGETDLRGSPRDENFPLNTSA